MNREAIRELVVANSGRDDKTTLMNSLINVAARKLSSEHLWLDLMTEADLGLETGGAHVDLPSNFHRLAEVRLIVDDSPLLSREISVKPKTYIVKQYPNINDENTGKPVYGYLQGTKLYLLPLSDGDYTIRITYFKLHSDFSTDATECEIRHGGEAVAAYATHLLFMSLNMTEDAASWLAVYTQLKDAAIKVDKDNSATNYEAIPRGRSPRVSHDPQNDPFVRRLE